MSLWIGEWLPLDVYCTSHMVNFDYQRTTKGLLEKLIPATITPVYDLYQDTRRTSPTCSGVPHAQSSDATHPNANQQDKSVNSRQVSSATRGNQSANNSRLARRTLRNRHHDYERTYKRQITDGRPDESWLACGGAQCSSCTFYDRMGMFSYKQKYAWREDLLVSTILETMEILGLAGARSPTAKEKPVSRNDLDAFIQSPPIRGAFWEFYKMCGVSPRKVAPGNMAAKLTGWMPAVVRIIQAPSIGELKLARSNSDADEEQDSAGEYQGGLQILRKGGRSASDREARGKMATREGGETLDVHICFAHFRVKRPKTWDLGDYVLQFCVVAESWRRYGLQKGCNWGFGGAETVADLLCAVLLNWWTMTRYDCFEEQKHTRLSINVVWGEWMDRYPLLLQGDEMEQGSSIEEVLHGVGRAVML